jgi:hypothetical protein
MRSILFFKKGQLAGVALGLSYDFLFWPVLYPNASVTHFSGNLIPNFAIDGYLELLTSNIYDYNRGN